jgi:hypothetical protein
MKTSDRASSGIFPPINDTITDIKGGNFIVWLSTGFAS